MTAPDLGGDETAERIVAFLIERGAGSQPHAGRRTLLDHLVETYAIVRRWRQPPHLRHAALLHSVYGTDAYHRRLVSPTERARLAEIAGEPAERLAYLFGVTERKPLLAGTYRWLKQSSLTRAEHDALIVLHMANLAEQSQAPDGSPGRWLHPIKTIAELLHDSETITAPAFVSRLGSFTARDEQRTRSAYLAGLRETDPARRATLLGLAAAMSAVIAEPCLWLAHLSHAGGEDPTARAWAEQARTRLEDLGTTWDKRLGLDDALALTHSLAEPFPGSARATPTRRATGSEPGAARFLRYLQGGGGTYPGLTSRPWHDPEITPLATHLEQRYSAIRAEIDDLDPRAFHPEAEPIERRGDWDVAFLYERGRRRDDTCAALPVTTHAIEHDPRAVRAGAGLIYVSRMRPGTHIAAHRGPTNVRLRLHLGIAVPQGDCAIRVGDETRRWGEGEVLVFDDAFEHEAWNHTGEDRVVLIVDLWHPDLDGAEIALLEQLSAITNAQAKRLGRYWATNRDTAGQT